MEEKFERLDSEQGDIVIVFGNKTFKLSLLVSLMTEVILTKKLEELNNKLSIHGSGQLPSYPESSWSHKGVNCEILKPGKNWQQGKARIRVSMEFSPDESEIEEITEVEEKLEIKEPESPLDDLRRKINEATS